MHSHPTPAGRAGRPLLQFALLAAAIGLVAGCSPQDRLESRTFEGPTMGTSYRVTVTGLRQGSKDAQRVQQCIDVTLEEVDRHLSTYSPGSEVSALNRNGSTQWIPVSAPLIAVAAAAQRVSVESNGAFDITIAPLVRLWGFGPAKASRSGANAEPPSMEFIHDATANVGYSWLELRVEPEPAVRKGKVPLELDLDGIAPGHAVDSLSGCVARAGFANHLVRIGNEVRASGRQGEKGRGWQVAIAAPVENAREPYTDVDLSGLAISTASNGPRVMHMRDGRVVSRFLDPRTGEPVRHTLASVSVVHPRATLADAYATALMVLGPDEGYALAERLDLPALFLERVGQSNALRERSTPAFQALRRPARQASL